MKLIVGLGNPGEKYKNTRHNAGFLLVDELEKLQLPDVELFKPQKFMNRSGGEVKRWLKNREEPFLQNLYVGHDDLDIPLGKFKIHFGKGPRVHNGLLSIYEQLGTKDFWHIRIGIENRHNEAELPIHRLIGNQSGEEYVLSNWRPQERAVINAVIEKAIKELHGQN